MDCTWFGYGTSSQCDESRVTRDLFFPTVAVSVWRQSGRHFRRKIDVFRRVIPADIHQGFFMVLSREQLRTPFCLDLDC